MDSHAVNIGYIIILAAAAAVTFALITVAQPLLRSYALARPNVRSSHKVATPQGGGIFVVVVVVVAAAAAAVYTRSPFALDLAWVLSAVILLAVVGAIDDIRVLEVVPRLVLQAIAVAAVIWSLPPDLKAVPFVPWWLDRAVLFVAGLWFVNLVNFMDGIDWMTVAEVVPVSAGLALFGAFGALPQEATAAAFALCGAMIGFAPFNRPVARLFLGDVGSLPIGLLLGWLLMLLAARGHLAAALLLPLYYLADATVTLLVRLVAGEPVMQAHRSHFYQRAFDGGLGIGRIIGSVFTLNLALIGLAAATMMTAAPLVQAAALAAGVVLVALLLRRFARVRA